MHGNAVYVDKDNITWQGIFVEGQFDSKIQKKLQAEKALKDKVSGFEQSCQGFFSEFIDCFNKSDKKTFKDNLGPFFGSTEQCIDFINVPAYPKFEDKAPEKWNELVTAIKDATDS